MKSFQRVAEASLLLSSLVSAQSYTPATSTNSDAPVIDLGYVSYVGYQNATAGINYYRGIPYAQPPVGPMRWQKPHPIEAMNNFTGETINATQIAPACFGSQPNSLYTSAEGFQSTPWGASEDCLILDVLVPSNPKSKYLPVLFQVRLATALLRSLSFSDSILDTWRRLY